MIPRLGDRVRWRTVYYGRWTSHTGVYLGFLGKRAIVQLDSGVVMRPFVGHLEVV